MRSVIALTVVILGLSVQFAEAQPYKFCRAYAGGTMYLSELFESDVSHIKLGQAFGQFVKTTYNVADVSSDQCYYYSSRRDAAYSYQEQERHGGKKTGWSGGDVPTHVTAAQGRVDPPSRAPSAPRVENTKAQLAQQRRQAMEVLVAKQIVDHDVAIRKLLQQRVAEIKQRRAACRAGDRDACRVDMSRSGASKQ